jgi:hypothetical protein
MENLNIKLSEQPTMTCAVLDEDHNLCENTTFFPVMFFKELSPMMSPSGKEELIPVETYRCSACGSIPNRFPQPE